MLKYTEFLIIYDYRLYRVQRVSYLINLINSTVDDVEGKVFSCCVTAASFCPRSGILTGTAWKKSFYSTL